MKTSFSLSLVLSKAWNALKANFWILVGIIIAYGILSFSISMIQNTGGVISFLMTLLSIFLSTIFSLGYTRMCLDSVEGKEPQFSSFQEQMPKFWKYLGLSLLIGVAAVIYMAIVMVIVVLLFGATSGGDYIRAFFNIGTIGLLLIFILMLPLIYVGIRIQFATILMVGTNCGIIEALTRSWNITEDHIVNLILLALLILGLCILGVLALVVGLLVVVPLTFLMQVVVYKLLTGGVIKV